MTDGAEDTRSSPRRLESSDGETPNKTSKQDEGDDEQQGEDRPRTPSSTALVLTPPDVMAEAVPYVLEGGDNDDS